MRLSLKWTGMAVLLAAMTGCPKPADNTEDATQLSISPSLKTIDDKGQNSTLRVTALDATGKAGTGDVKLTTPAGFLGNAQKSVTLTLDADGKASTTFSCPVAQDPGCAGSVRIDATWGSISSNTTLQVGTTITTTPTDGGTTTTTPTDGGTTNGGGGVVTEQNTPANIQFDPTTAKTQLGVRSSGLDTASAITFLVVDIAGKPVSNTTVTFSVAGPGGVSVVPASAQTDSAGKASTLLQSGDEVGVATVSGKVTTTAGGVLQASSKTIPIVGARVSDRGFVTECQTLVISANMTETPPRKDVTTKCTANLSDRFGNPTTAKTLVTWYSEAGSITSPTETDNNGQALTVLSTAGKWPPVPVDPLSATQAETAEPNYVRNGKTYNPRDMLVTIIAVTAGEEEYVDGSGASNGVKNGQWDKGEWFVDTPEPFVDANDNQIYDYGEAFIDTERLNCTTGLVEPRNGKWDGPNGCWDGNTQLWHPTHVVYSGYNTLEPPLTEQTPYFVFKPPASVEKFPGTAGFAFRITDAYLNIIGQENAAFFVAFGGSDGTADLNAAASTDPNTRTYGFQILYERVEAVPDSSSLGYTTGGVCDPGKTAAAGAGTDPKLARCVWRYRFGKFETQPNIGVVKMVGATTAGPYYPDITVGLGNNYGKAFRTFNTTQYK